MGRKRGLDPRTKVTIVHSDHQRMQEGGTRWGPAVNHARTEQSVWKSLWWLNRVLCNLSSISKPNKKDYKEAMTLMSKHVDGVNTLLSQKLIILAVMTGLLEDPEWLSFVQPGSPAHFEGLLGEPYNLATKAQIPQAVELLHTRLKVSSGHAEEFVCSQLKTRDHHCDVLIENQHLYSFELDQAGKMQFLQHKYGSPSQVFRPPPLESSISRPENNYVPLWVNGEFAQAGGKVHLADDKINQKSGRKPVWYDPFSAGELFGMGDVKTLLNKSCYHVLVDVEETTRLHLGIRKELLLSPTEGITIHGCKGDGWISSPGQSFTNVLGSAYSGHNDVREPKRCHVGVHSTQPDGSLRYISPRHARLSMLFHLLFNVQSKQITHWCSTLLGDRPELVILARLYPNRYCTDTICTIFRDSSPDGQIMYKVFNDARNEFMRGEIVRTGW